MLKLRLPGPAMGVALFALFIALGGASVAATNDFLPRNSVGTQQMQNNSVTRAKIAHQTISNVLIKPGSLMASSFAAGQIPAGPKGDTGASGPAGERGPAGTLSTISVLSNKVCVEPTHTEVVAAVGNGKLQAIAVSTSWGKTIAGAQFASVSVSPVLGASNQPIGYEAAVYNGDTVQHCLTLHVSFG